MRVVTACQPAATSCTLDDAAPGAAGIRAEVAAAHAEIGHLVASALEAGGPTWCVTAALLATLVGPEWHGAPPIVLARALARAQRHEAAEVSRLLAAGSEASAAAMRDGLLSRRARLVAILAC